MEVAVAVLVVAEVVMVVVAVVVVMVTESNTCSRDQFTIVVVVAIVCAWLVVPMLCWHHALHISCPSHPGPHSVVCCPPAAGPGRGPNRSM